MAADQSFRDLLAGLRNGTNDAATALFQRFAKRLIGLAHSRLDQQLLQKMDAEDVVQSVFRSFFTRYTGDSADFDFASWDSVWGLLVLMTVRKCGRQTDHFHTESRDVHREVSTEPAPDQSGRTRDLRSPEPTPEEAVMLTDLVEKLLSRFEGRQHLILSLRLQGFSPAEISAQAGCSERSVFRALEQARAVLEETLGENGAGT